jgi:peroxiredoxin
LPSFQRILSAAFPVDKLTIIGINSSSSKSWLLTYRGQYGISYPLVFDDQSKLFSAYQVGPTFGNIPPSYVLIDTKGVVRFRTDDKFDQTEAISKKVSELLAQ